MVPYSTQIRTVTSLALSFQKNQKINVSVSNSTLERDKIFLKPGKFQLQTESNFKFISLWSIFKYQTSKIDTLKHLQELENEDVKSIMKIKEKLSLYQNTLINDRIFTQSLVLKPENVFKLFQQNKVSLLYVYWFFKDYGENLPRLQQRQLDRIRFFLSYFPTIEDYLDTTS